MFPLLEKLSIEGKQIVLLNFNLNLLKKNTDWKVTQLMSFILIPFYHM